MKLFKTSEKCALQQGLDRDREQAGHGAMGLEEAPQATGCGCGERSLFKRVKEPDGIFHVDLRGGWVKP